MFIPPQHNRYGVMSPYLLKASYGKILELHKMKYIFGPIKSRRLGSSLGINLTPYKTCTFDCVYCQLGRTNTMTTERKEYIPLNEILDELKNWLATNTPEEKQLNYITLSGSGEPTLNIKTGELISKIKELTGIAVAVITNASLLSDPQLRQEIKDADLVVPSLDAATAVVFEKIDRPHENMNIEDIIEGLASLRKEFKGKIWLEIMIVRGVNDDLRHVRKLKEAADRINPDKIQINSPVRAPVEAGVLPADRKKLEKIKEILGEKAEII